MAEDNLAVSIAKSCPKGTLIAINGLMDSIERSNGEIVNYVRVNEFQKLSKKDSEKVGIMDLNEFIEIFSSDKMLERNAKRKANNK